jgi:predicted thioesterase
MTLPVGLTGRAGATRAADDTSVGTRVEVDHRAATAVGGTVEAQAHLVSVDGPRLAFAVVVREGARTVAAGRVERMVVDRLRFAGRS